MTARRGAAPATLLVIAKEPVAGRVKTRLCPPLAARQAAQVAAAALADTLDAVAAAPAQRRVLVLDGNRGPWLPDGFEVVPQLSGGLDVRLAGALASMDGPCLLVGMDTPQVSADLLADGVDRLARGAEAVIGPAADGGFWAIGLAQRAPAAFPGVPMSTSGTYRAQLRRLFALGLDVDVLPTLCDVDVADDLAVVAGAAPDTRFAAVVGELVDTGALS